MIIYKQSRRIDFKTDIEWQERQVLLKTLFPVSIRTTKATYDIQFGNMERATHRNTGWDRSKFEVPAPKWADLSEGNYGVALLNDCKYGYGIKDNLMTLSLLKSPVSPDEKSDLGKHLLTYSIMPHGGSWRNRVVEESYDLNNSLMGVYLPAKNKGSLPASYQFVESSTDNIMIETVKKAEDNQDALIIRLYEYKNYQLSDVKLRFNNNIKEAVECNLLEDEIAEVKHKQQELVFDIKPYEIRTFKVWFKRDKVL